MASVQFRSIADTVAAFERMSCEVWSLWDGKRFMFKGVGADELRGFLDLMDNNGSTNAAYILAYYDGLEDASTVNNKTAFDGSFSFRLNSDGTEITTGQYKRIHTDNELVSKVNALEHKLDAVLERDDDEDSESNSLGVIGQILGHPSIAPVLPLLVEKIVSSILSPAAVQPVLSMPTQLPLRKVSGVDPVHAAAHASAVEGVKDAVLQNAISRLQKADDKLALHLSKLADLSERDPNSFNYIVKMLESLQTT